MRTLLMLGALALGISCVSAPAKAACDPKDRAFICGLKHPEDLVHLQGTQWVLASAFDLEMASIEKKPTIKDNPAPTMAIRIDTHAVQQLIPAASNTADWDRNIYPDCKTPPKTVTSLGLSVKKLEKNKHRLYIVNRSREAVEVYDVNVAGKDPVATWRGCLPTPAGMPSPNSVAPLPDDGLVLSGSGVQMWQPGKGWKKVGDVKGSNGIESAPDGKTIYVNDVFAHVILKMDLDGKVLGTTPKFDFHPDNIRWGDDGALYASGAVPGPKGWIEACFARAVCDAGFASVRIDPATWKVTEVIRSTGIKDNFGAATVALKIGKEIWLGTFRGDRIMIHALKK